MCFIIDPRAKPPDNTKAYKVVRLRDNGEVTSLVYTGKTWTAGVHRIRKNAKTTKFREYQIPDSPLSQQSHEGIYAYNCFEDAKEACWRANWAILELQVRPADWLFSKHDGRQSTYRKVTVPEKQKFIKWYRKRRKNTLNSYGM